jgi:NAD(P)H-nitrite reductase large subunit
MADVAINKLVGTPRALKSLNMSTKLKIIGVDGASFG